MFTGAIKNGFIKSSAKPLVGTLYAHTLDNALKEALIKTATQLLPGDPVVSLVTQAGQATGQLDGFNPNSQEITAKATTVTGGAGSTDTCGFLLVNSNDRVKTGSVGIPEQGQRVVYAPLGQGAIVWLEIAELNKADFQTNNDANMPLTIDSTNGGLKKGTGTDVLKGAKIIQGLTDAVKIKINGGVAEITDCLAIAVQLM